MPKLNDRMYRVMSLLSATENEKLIESDFYVEGYATTIESRYLLWEMDGWKCYEIIARNAFDGTDMSDVIMQFDHCGKVYARQSNGSLVLVVDSKGLKIGADLSRSAGAKDLYEEINSKLVTKMSWAFVPDRMSRTYDDINKTITITIEHVKKIYDVSAVSIPANDQTSISARADDGSTESASEELAFIRKAAADKEQIKLLIEMEALK